MIDICQISSKSAEDTANTGFYFLSTIYNPQTTVLLHGELGAGKTTFTQGCARALNITDDITSPTFALEHRYNETLLHMDLFRLSAKDAQEQLAQTEDFPGMRIVEWPKNTDAIDVPHITVSIKEPSETIRDITIEYSDIAIPSDDMIDEWRRDMFLPTHIVAHTEQVATVADRLANHCITRGIPVRKHALRAAAKCHDLLKFVDFSLEEQSATTEEKARWNALQQQYPHAHESAASQFLTEQGYPEIGEIIRTHGRPSAEKKLETIEQKLLTYADLRVLHETVVTTKERFDDFVERFNHGKESSENILWRTMAQQLETALFPDGPPL